MKRYPKIINYIDDINDNDKDVKNNIHSRTKFNHNTTKFPLESLYIKMATMSLNQEKQDYHKQHQPSNNNKMLLQIKEEENTSQDICTPKSYFPSHIVHKHTKEDVRGDLCKCKKIKKPLFENGVPRRKRPKRCKAYYCMNI